MGQAAIDRFGGVFFFFSRLFLTVDEIVVIRKNIIRVKVSLSVNFDCFLWFVGVFYAFAQKLVLLGGVRDVHDIYV